MASPKKVQGSPVFNMLAALARSPDDARMFKENPDEILNRYALTDDQKAAIRKAIKEGKPSNFYEDIGGVPIEVAISC